MGGQAGRVPRDEAGDERLAIRFEGRVVLRRQSDGDFLCWLLCQVLSVWPNKLYQNLASIRQGTPPCLEEPLTGNAQRVAEQTSLHLNGPAHLDEAVSRGAAGPSDGRSRVHHVDD